MCNLLRFVPDSLVKLEEPIPFEKFREAKFKAFESLFVQNKAYTKEEIIDILTKNKFPCPYKFLRGHVDSPRSLSVDRERLKFNKVTLTNGTTVYMFSWDTTWSYL